MKPLRGTANTGSWWKKIQGFQPELHSGVRLLIARKVLSPHLGSGLFRVECAWSPCANMGSLWIPQLSPTAQRHACRFINDSSGICVCLAEVCVLALVASHLAQHLLGFTPD